MGVNLLALLAQADSFPTAHGGEHHLTVLVGEGALAVHHRGAVVQVLDDEVADFIGLGSDDGEEFAQVDENMPVSMPKKKQAAKAMTLSLTKRALPMSEMLVYFFKIMATMSVPPEEAL